MVTWLDRPQGGEQPVGRLGPALLGRGDRLERVEDRVRARPRRGRGRSAPAPPRSGSRASGCRPIRARRMMSRGAAAAARLEARREILALAPQPAQPRQRAMARRARAGLRASRASRSAIARSTWPSANCAAARPSSTAIVVRARAAAPARTVRSRAGRPPGWCGRGCGRSADRPARAPPLSRTRRRRAPDPRDCGGRGRCTCQMRASPGWQRAPPARAAAAPRPRSRSSPPARRP